MSQDHYGQLGSLALDAQGNPHIAYLGTASRLQYAVRDTEGWHITTVANDAAGASSLALDHNDHPHIVYFSGGQLRYVIFNGDYWSDSVIDTGTLDGPLTGGVSLALDSASLG